MSIKQITNNLMMRVTVLFLAVLLVIQLSFCVCQSADILPFRTKDGNFIRVKEVTVAADIPQRTNIISWWKFDTTNSPTLETMGTTNVGVFVSTGRTWIAQAKIGGGYDMGTNSQDVANGYFTCGADSSLDITNRSITISAWIRPAISTRDYMSVIAKTDSSWVTGYNLFFYGNYPLAGNKTWEFCVNDYTVSGASFKTNIVDGQWHHIVGTYDGTNVCFYVDYSSYTLARASVAYTNQILTTSNPLRIGKATGGYNYWGGMDEVIIWRTALASNEVKDLYYYGY